MEVHKCVQKSKIRQNSCCCLLRGNVWLTALCRLDAVKLSMRGHNDVHLTRYMARHRKPLEWTVGGCNTERSALSLSRRNDKGGGRGEAPPLLFGLCHTETPVTSLARLPLTSTLISIISISDGHILFCRFDDYFVRLPILRRETRHQFQCSSNVSGEIYRLRVPV